MTQKFSRSELVARLVRAGELEVSGEDPAETDTYFDQENFRFHDPGGFETGYAGLSAYFASVRAAFDDRKITRGIIVAEGSTMACQTWIEGTFVREFTHSPAGPLPPTGTRVIWDLINIFRFDGNGRLTEEYVRTDYRSFLRQLGAEGRRPTRFPRHRRPVGRSEPAVTDDAGRSRALTMPGKSLVTTIRETTRSNWEEIGGNGPSSAPCPWAAND